MSTTTASPITTPTAASPTTTPTSEPKTTPTLRALSVTRPLNADDFKDLSCDVAVFTVAERKTMDIEDRRPNIIHVSNLVTLEKDHILVGHNNTVKDIAGQKIIMQVFFVSADDEQSARRALLLLGYWLLGIEKGFLQSHLWSPSPEYAKNWQYFEAAFASYGKSPHPKTNYSITAGEKLVTPDGQEETEVPVFDTKSTFYWRNFQAPSDVYLLGVKIGIIILKNKGPIGPIARYQREYFYDLLRPTFSDTELPINGPTVVVQLAVEGIRNWRILFLVLQDLVEILSDKVQITRDSQSSHRISNSEQETASNVYSLMTRLNRFDNMFLKTQSSASQFIEQVNFYQARKTKTVKNDDEDDVLDQPGGLGDFMGMAEGGYENMYTSADLAIDDEMAESFPDWNRREWELMMRNQKDLLEGIRALQRQMKSLRNILASNDALRESQAANRAADEAAYQGHTMRRMMVLTFIFLPLTFLATVFGMNFEQFGQGDVQVWWFFAMGVPLLLLVLGSWGWWEYRAKKKRLAKENSVSP